MIIDNEPKKYLKVTSKHNPLGSLNRHARPNKFKLVFKKKSHVFGHLDTRKGMLVQAWQQVCPNTFSKAKT